MAYAELEVEIIRAYSVLGVIADMQNYRDIEKWYADGIINEYQLGQLHSLNNRLARKYW